MKMITVTVASLGSPEFTMEINHKPEMNDAENINRALYIASSLAKREVSPGENDSKKMVYEVIFHLKDGGCIRGYSDKVDPERHDRFYRYAATKELKGRVIVAAEYITSFRFTPL